MDRYWLREWRVRGEAWWSSNFIDERWGWIRGMVRQGEKKGAHLGNFKVFLSFNKVSVYETNEGGGKK